MKEILFRWIAPFIVVTVMWKYITDYKSLKRDIFNKLSFYADIYSNPLNISKGYFLNKKDEIDFLEDKEKRQKVKLELRSLAASLESFPQEVIGYKIFSKIGIFPKKNRIEEAFHKILSISNRLVYIEPPSRKINIGILNGEDADKVKELL